MRILSGIMLPLLLMLAASLGPTFAAEIPAAEEARIEQLIQSIERLADARFIRNGRAHDAATAGYFLRRKWDSRRHLVRSAEDFITQVASGSSTTSQPYLIRFADGREVECGVYLRSELQRLAP